MKIEPIIQIGADDPETFARQMGVAAPEPKMRKAGRGRFHATARVCPLPRMAIFEVSAEALEVAFEKESGFLGITIPIAGAFDSFDGRKKTNHPAARSAHFLGPHSPFRIEIPAARLLVTNFFQPILSEFESLGEPTMSAIRDGRPLLDLESDEGQSFLRYSQCLWRELKRKSALLRNPVALRHVEGTMLALLLDAARPVSRGNTGGAPRYSPAKLDLAEEFMRANLGEAISVADIARAVGISVRTLHRLFADIRGTSPGKLLKSWRMEAVRDALRSADPEQTTVTDIAPRFGFYHLSQFARDYRRTYGELPSLTLQRHHR